MVKVTFCAPSSSHLDFLSHTTSKYDMIQFPLEFEDVLLMGALHWQMSQ
jgi:hypothetical protein